MTVMLFKCQYINHWSPSLICMMNFAIPEQMRPSTSVGIVVASKVNMLHSMFFWLHMFRYPLRGLDDARAPFH